jgi:adenosylcobinamide-GDP ribazoletransferase
MGWIAEQLRLLLLAWQFFTRIPIGTRLEAFAAYTPERLRASARYFPFVGLLLGAMAALVWLAAVPLWGAGVAGALALTTTALLTGAFHEDGLSDYADSFGATSREQALAIMKDSRIGSFGALALVLSVALKLMALWGLAQWQGAFALLCAHSLGRLLPCALMAALPYVRDDASSKHKPLATHVMPLELIAAALPAAAALGCAVAFNAITPLHALGTIAALLVLTWAIARHLKRRLGGFTGDTLGAAQELAQIVVLLGFAART